MTISIRKTPLETVLLLRNRYLRNTACQIVHNSHHARGFTDLYLIKVDGALAGYGAVGSGKLESTEDAVMEFFVLPAFRPSALAIFRRLLKVSHARRIRCQTNDTLLTLMLFDSAQRIKSGTILFHHALDTQLSPAGTIFRKAVSQDANRIFRHDREPVGAWVLEWKQTIVATGGILFHYNRPYGDLFMEVAAPYRRRGFGSYLVQQLKRTCRRMGGLPTARCDAANIASRRTLEKAGMVPCARILWGTVLPELR